MTTYVLVPGAWIGGWAWRDTARALRSLGHEVYPVTLTGLGERSHLAGPLVDLETHIADIVGLIEYEDLRDVTLVGHSYAGAPVTGAAHRLPGRLRRLVYVDSAPFADGTGLLDFMPPAAAEALVRTVDETGEGWRMPIPPAEVLGETADLAGVPLEVLYGRAVAHPFGTYRAKLRLTGDLDAGVERMIVVCNDFRRLLGLGLPQLAFLRGPEWRRVDLDSGHWPMLSMPTELAGALASPGGADDPGAGEVGQVPA